LGKNLRFQETFSTAWLNFVSLAYFARLAQETVALFSIIFLDKKIASIQKKINSRLRQKLKFETPKAEFFKRIA
jgi:hypothetical protein